MKAVLFIMLYKLVLTFESVDEILKVPISEFFLFSHLNLNIILRTSVKEFFDLHKTRIFYEFYKTFKFAAISH